MARTIYLEIDEEILSVLQKIKKAGEDEVVVVAPRGAKILKNLTSLKLVKEQSERLGKSIEFATADERGKVLLGRAGLKLTQTIPQAAKPTVARVTRFSGTGQGMGDIMMRPPRAKSGPAKKIVPVIQPKAQPEPAETQEELSELIGPAHAGTEINFPKPRSKSRFPIKYIFLAALAIILAAAALVFYVLPSAEVTVTARTEPVTRDLEVLVDSQKGVPDIQSLTIPGKKLTEEVSDSKSYPATGVKRVGEKASGFVTLYNFSKSTLILKSSTTRLEANGKVFYFLQDAGSIRPTGRIGADLEIDPSSLVEPVPVVAAEAGEDYNLPAGTKFDIYNEVFGHKPDVLYAVNANPLAGGTNKEVKIVSDADVKAARQDLAKQLIEKFRGQIKQKLTADTKLADNAFKLEVTEESVTPPVGTEKEQFQLTQKAKVSALVYNETDLRDLIVERIVRLLPKEKYLMPASQQSLAADFISLDLDAGSGTLRSHFESEVKYNINSDFLARSLLGKNETQVKEILLARPEIEDVKVKFSPFWVKSVPMFESKLTIIVAR